MRTCSICTADVPCWYSMPQSSYSCPCKGNDKFMCLFCWVVHLENSGTDRRESACPHCKTTYTPTLSNLWIWLPYLNRIVSPWLRVRLLDRERAGTQMPLTAHQLCTTIYWFVLLACFWFASSPHLLAFSLASAAQAGVESSLWFRYTKMNIFNQTFGLALWLYTFLGAHSPEHIYFFLLTRTVGWIIDRVCALILARVCNTDQSWNAIFFCCPTQPTTP